MFGDVAEQMLTIMGKRNEKQGVITVEQIPDAIAKLKRAIAGNKNEHAKIANADQDSKTVADKGQAVSLTQRAVPLVELLEYSLKAETPVMWNVN